MMENVTANELAGFGVGALLICATIAAPKVDSFIAASQRSSLGLCKRCGGLRMIACPRCKGAGSVRGGPNFFSIFDVGGQQDKVASISCITCQGKGNMSCSECSNN
ncbi:hypothetical protein Syun_010053 [Stephania yunnanensis]|uniref:Uncharacterized protein n=1 Tax=Stephania yunnanensis TaxID=152371 RepID=A0AAP0KHN3_9MAGN